MLGLVNGKWVRLPNESAPLYRLIAFTICAVLFGLGLWFDSWLAAVPCFLASLVALWFAIGTKDADWW